MSTTETPNLGLVYPDVGTEDNNWGDLLNAIFDLIDDLIGGVLSKSVAGGADVTLTAAEAAHHTIYLTGLLTANINVVVPSKQRNYRIYNNTTGAFTVTVKTSGGSGVLIDQGDKGFVSCDGSDCLDFLDKVLAKSGGQLTGALDEAKGTDIASAASVDLGAATGNFVEMTGTATITALGTVAAGARREVRFTGTPTIVHGTSLLLPGEANIATAANDGATFISLGSGAWWCSKFQQAAADPEIETTGRLLRRTVYTADDTWSKGDDVGFVIVQVQAGGGAGGSADGAASAASRAGGGGGGGYSSKKILAAALAATEAITVGDGGTPSAAGANAGGDGGTSSFGAHCSATGGTGGTSGASGTNATYAPGGAGGVGSSGDLNAAGSCGGTGIRLSGTVTVGGEGGGSPLGGGAPTVNSNDSDGIAGAVYGGGGSAGTSTTTTDRQGGAGAAGVVIVEEYS